MANKIKGLTIELNGDTTGLDKALKGVNAQSRDLQSELRQVDRLLKLDPGNVELAAQKQKILAESVNNTKEKLDTLKEAERQVAEQFKKGEVGEEQYRAIQREIISTEQNLKSLDNQLGEINNKWKNAADGIGNFGKGTAELGNKLMPISAGAGAAAAGLVGLAVKAGVAADDINTLSKQTGISTEDLQIFQLASDRIDVSMDTLTGSMTKLTKNMGNAQKGSKTATDAFDKLGVSFKDNVTGELRDNQDVFNDAINALGQIENETERDALAMEIFGKSAQDLNPLILGGADALKTMGKEAKDAGLILSQDALDGINEFNDEIDTLKATAGATFMQLGVEIGKVLLPALQGLSEKLQGLLEWVRNLDEGTLKIIMTVLAVVAGLAPLLIIIGKIASGVSAIMGVVSSLGSGFAALGTAIGAISAPVLIVIGVIAGLIAVLVALYNNNEEFRNKITELWESIKAMFSSVLDAIIGIVMGAMEAIQGFWGEHGSVIMEIVGKLFEALGLIFSKSFENLKLVVETFINLVKGIWKLFGDEITAVMTVCWDTIKGIISGALTIINGLLDVFIGLFTGDWERMKTGIIEIFTGLWTVIESIVAGAWTLLSGAFAALWENISNWFTGLKDSAVEWGKNMIQGFIDGIMAMARKVQDAVSSVMEGVSDFIGFNSPSKKGEGRHIVEWGYNMIDGFMEGMKKAMPELNVTANQLIPNLDTKSSISNVNNAKVAINFYPQNMTEQELNKAFNYVNRRLGLAL